MNPDPVQEIKDLVPELKTEACPNCGDLFQFPQFADAYFVVCKKCEKLLPPALVKAAADPFGYALGLRDGTTFLFNSCSFHGEYVHLEIDTCHKHQFPFERGVDVRLSEIVWAADAPYGS